MRPAQRAVCLEQLMTHLYQQYNVKVGDPATECSLALEFQVIIYVCFIYEFQEFPNFRTMTIPGYTFDTRVLTRETSISIDSNIARGANEVNSAHCALDTRATESLCHVLVVVANRDHLAAFVSSD